ncbi:MAG: hypothetical protein JWO38_2209 [Gemmataceae bacterium]|nr:hypothetical protein [Gemmataceae bacterium]
MTMPGFTADDSLRGAGGGHRTPYNAGRAEEGVHPAFRGSRCMSKCIRECVGLDPYCAQNCDCICNGRPGRTCFLE